MLKKLLLITSLQRIFTPTMQSPSALQSVLAAFSSLFWFRNPQLYCVLASSSSLFWFWNPQLYCLVHHCSSVSFATAVAGQLFFSNKSSCDPHVHYLASTKWQVGNISHQLVNIVEQLRSKIFLPRGGGEQNRAKSRLFCSCVSGNPDRFKSLFNVCLICKFHDSLFRW